MGWLTERWRPLAEWTRSIKQGEFCQLCLEFRAEMGVQCHATQLCEEENHLTRRREDTLRLQTAYLGRRRQGRRSSGGKSDIKIAEYSKP